MAQFITKPQTVEARPYLNELPLTVVHDEMGEMVAHKGDWLVGNKRGQVAVVANDKFHARYQPYTATPELDNLKAAQATIDAQAGAIAAAKATSDALTAKVTQLQADKDASAKVVDNTKALTAQVADLTAKLTVANDKAAQAEQKLTLLSAAQKAEQDAQKVISDSQSKLNQQLG